MKKLTINDLGFSLSTIYCLRSDGIETPEQLVTVVLEDPKQLMAIPNVGRAKFKEIMDGATIAINALGDTVKVKKTPMMNHKKTVDLLVMMASVNLISVPTNVSGFGMRVLRKHGFINDKDKLRHAIFSGEFSKIRSVGPVTTAEACWWLINGEEE